MALGSLGLPPGGQRYEWEGREWQAVHRLKEQARGPAEGFGALTMGHAGSTGGLRATPRDVGAQVGHALYSLRLLQAK